MTDSLYLAVNGTLMRGLELNGNLLAIAAAFMCETQTAPIYRLWSISDRYPAMLRVTTGGAAIALEIWQVPIAGLPQLLRQEPPGLCLGQVQLGDGETVWGILGEPYICENQREITQWGGWRSYQAAANQASNIPTSADLLRP
ncbi:allophanate hydrolase-related protein [Trichothermofontia sp.]